MGFKCPKARAEYRAYLIRKNLIRKDKVTVLKFNVTEEEKKKRALYSKRYYAKLKKEGWSLEKLSKCAAKSARRRASKWGAVPVHLRYCPREKERLYKIYRLRYVMGEATGVEHNVDHMWPLSKGGPHWSGNLQVITREENSLKRASFCEETSKVISDSLRNYQSDRSI